MKTTRHINFVFFVTVCMTVLFSACTSTTTNRSSTLIELPQLSVQLWSVKDDLKNDYKGTLSTLADMGFDGVEFAGEFGEFADDPAGLKTYLNELGLSVSGAHLSFEKLNTQNFAQTIAFYKALDCPSLIIPYDERAWHPEKVIDVVKDLNNLAEKLAEHNMQVGFHNHQYEFNAYKQATYWDYLAVSTRKNVIMQQDVGWTSFAAKDPVEYVRRYPGRTLTTHYKAMFPDNIKNKLPIIGLDIIDWAALIKANAEVGGTQWIVIEQEEYPNELTPLQAVAESKKGLDKFLQEYVSQKN